MLESEDVPPSVNLIESMRSIGYSLEAAIADLIDNSVGAEARNITIDVDVVHGEYLALLDDGHGMEASAAREALRLAGSVGDRSRSDLGRFGLGLKTASLSQARCLTVVTKHDGVVTALRWDIDFVRTTGRWLLLTLDGSDLVGLPLWTEFESLRTGTLVIWNRLDLLLGDTASPGAYLAQRLGSVRSSLSLVFHRFLADWNDRLRISINGLPLEPLDPFLERNSKTQRSSPEAIRIADAEVIVEAFTLPHATGLSAAERRRPDLGEDMKDWQGFYVYRKRRLISHGHWYGLSRMNELSKQTRVRVDVPAELDSLWQLDIKKSRVEPPQSFKLRLRQLIEPMLARGHRLHTFRGRRENTPISHIWSKTKTRDGFGYEVNLESPAVKSVLSQLATEDAERVIGLMQTMASTFPIMDAYAEVAANATAIDAKPDRESLIARLKDIRESGLFSTQPDVAITQLAGVEPFNTIDYLPGLVTIVWEAAEVDTE